MEKALDRQRAREDWKDAAINASSLSQLLLARGELGGALVRAREGVELADRSRDAFQCMVSRTVVAAALHAMGRLEEAAAQFEEAERMQEEEASRNIRCSTRSGASCTATSCSIWAGMPRCGSVPSKRRRST